MSDWFSVQKIDGDTFVISESKHWEDTHCYLLAGSDRALLIDSGLGVDDITPVVNSLTDLPVTVVATHVHFDHIGGHGGFGSRLVHKNEHDWIIGNNPTRDEYARRVITLRPCDFPSSFKKEDYRIFKGSADILCGGEVIDLGGRKITVVNTPGHSPGHMSFFEEDRGYLYSGDVAYKGNLGSQYLSSDPVLFFESVKKLCTLKVKKLLPPHFDLDVAPPLLNKIADAFSSIEQKGLLRLGGGRFEFDDFKIFLSR